LKGFIHSIFNKSLQLSKVLRLWKDSIVPVMKKEWFSQ